MIDWTGETDKRTTKISEDEGTEGAKKGKEKRKNKEGRFHDYGAFIEE